MLTRLRNWNKNTLVVDTIAMVNRNKVPIFFGLFHILLFMHLFLIISQNYSFGAGFLERQIAAAMIDGRLPYSDFPSEYPPLALLSFLIPGLVSLNLTHYNYAFTGEMLLLDLVAIFLIVRLARNFNLSVNKALTVYTLAIIATGPILVARYDILPAVLVLAALYFFIQGKHKLAWATIALGITAKIYPIIIVPFFFISQLRNKQFGKLFGGIAVFLIVILALTLPWLIIDAKGFLGSLNYHMLRGLHSETTYGTALLIGQLLGLTSVKGELTYGSWNLSSPLADQLAKASNYILAVLLIAVYILFAFLIWNKQKNRENPNSNQASLAPMLLGFSSLAIIVFLISYKVFSIQFIIWLCPFIPFLAEPKRDYMIWLFIIIGVLTQFTYPYHYIDFESGKAYAVAVMASRNFLLIIMAIIIGLPYISQSRTLLHEISTSRAKRTRA